MDGTPYGIADAERDLRAALGQAPAGAVAGAWSASTMQAGYSDISGGYTDAAGHDVDAEPRNAFAAVEAAVSRLFWRAHQPDLFDSRPQEARTEAGASEGTKPPETRPKQLTLNLWPK